MKRTIRLFEKAFSTFDFGSWKSDWKHLKNTTYTPDKDKESIFLRDREFEIKYTRKAAPEVLQMYIFKYQDL